jgi:chemotaxis protein histidine kinase CheA
VDTKKAREALLEKFRSICTERINTLVDLFAKVQDKPDDADIIEKLMREIHTLKGELKIMSFPEGGQIVHALEDGLKVLRDNAFANATTLYDMFTEILDAVSGNVLGDVKPDVEDFRERLSAWGDTYTPGKKKDDSKVKPKKKPKSKPKPKSKAKPKAESKPKKPAEAPRPEPVIPQTEDPRPQMLPNVVRVSGAKLDQLGDMAGDLFTSYLRLSKISSALDGVLLDIRNLTAAITHLETVYAELNLPVELHPAWQCQKLNRDVAQMRRAFNDRVSGMATSLDQVIDHVRELRLLPVSTVFDLYLSAAREIARERDKKVSIRIEGGSTMVDRSVLDTLNDVLVHMIRNAVDHGIEYPQERQEAGKPPHGSMVLRARVVGDRILIDVEDDGKGIDVEVVRKSALQKGLISEMEAENLDSEGTLSLIFRSGFSTTKKATELSGRGVGMDVVWTRVQELGGAVRVDSKPGRGTCFTLEMPTSIAITRVLLFSAAEQSFAILATFVDRVVRLERESVIDVSGGMAIVLDDQTIPAAAAAEVLQIGRDTRDEGKLPIIVVEHGGRTLALIVDEVLGERELTIKPLGMFLAGIRGVSGAAMLEDGTVILVLHAGDVVSSAGRPLSRMVQQATRIEDKVRRALLVEDSLITRELERSMLASLGLHVEEAADGREAMEKLRAMTFDIIVSDVEMPHINGFELTERVKQDQRWSHIPVILVTTRGSSADRQRGVEVGADAYVVKSEFKSKSFIETVRRFLP